MFKNIGPRTDSVELTTPATPSDGPSYVAFFEGGQPKFTIGTKTFQTMRRAINRETGSRDHKVYLIKALRDISGLGLRDAKIAVEYFLENFPEDVA